jgi:hypothetical protein
MEISVEKLLGGGIGFNLQEANNRLSGLISTGRIDDLAERES